MMSKFSIVVPVYFNEENLPDTCARLLQLQEKLSGHALELIFVEDGSKDRSLEVLLQKAAEHPDQIVVLKLTRNFGSMAAIQAGFRHATGDCVGMISADLQDPPELFIQMFEHWQRGIKAVYAVRKGREDPWIQKIYSNSFYFLLKHFAIPEFPEQGFDFFLLDREVVNQFNEINENHTNIMALIFWMGYPSISIPYIRRAREKGKSRWTFQKKIKLFVDSFVSFSYAPIRFMSCVGILYAFLSFIYAGYLVYHKFRYNFPIPGWAALMVFLSFTVGMILLTLGIIGEYIWRISDAVKKRPQYIVDEIFKYSESDGRKVRLSSKELKMKEPNPNEPSFF